MTGLIGNIGRYSLKDGPGIRTTVFFKGCPLRCPWCHNPELVAGRPEIAFTAERCIVCGECKNVCPEDAIDLDGKKRVKRERCSACGKCVEDCPAKALDLIGRPYMVDELVEILLRDRFFYETSNGGVTLSGGEPTVQMKFSGQLLKLLKKKGVHTAVQTCGYFSWSDFEKILLDNVDLILFDVKIADSVAHREVVGKKNDVIWDNLKRLAAQRPSDIVARIPLIPGYTANEENMTRIASRLYTLRIQSISLLPYNSYGLDKCEKVGRVAANNLPQKSMKQEEVEKWQSYFDWAKMIVY